MEELGNLLGLVTGLGLCLTLLNFLVKWVNKHWINKLPKESEFKKLYISFMRFVVKNHRYFAISAVIAVLLHLFLQIRFKWISETGLITAGLLMVNVSIGAYLFFKLKGKRGMLFMVHRFVAVLLLVAFAAHFILKF